MARGWRGGVRRKLVIVSLLILIVVSFGFLLLHRHVSSAWIDGDLRNRAIVFAQEISATIRDNQEFESGPLLEDDIRHIMGVRSNILQLEILKFTPNGAEVVATSRVEKRLPFSREDRNRVLRRDVVSKFTNIGGVRAWDTLAPITVGSEVIGAVSARFSLAEADRLRQRIDLWAIVLTAVSVLIMGSLMAMAVTYAVNRPIASLLGAIRRIRDGDVSARAEFTSGDEFEALAGHFNEMMERINRFSGELDERVRMATRELDERVQEVQRLNIALYTTQRRLGQAERLAVAGQVVAQVAHEVGTPLHSVCGHLELLRSELPPGHAQRRLEIIEGELQRVSGIIRQLLDLVRRDRPQFAPVDLGGLVRDSAEFVSPGMSAAGIRLDVEIEPELPPVNGDRDQLLQVLLNLLSNALDATPPGGRVSIVARRRPAQQELAITVQDTGIGIPAGQQREIFEPFVSSKPRGKGTGLGLYIAAQILRDHGGRTELQSEEGKGSAVTAVLPVARDVQ